MKVRFDLAARDELDDIFAWISKDNESAAYNMIARIKARVELLATSGFSRMGRPGLDEGTHELVEPPYIIVYEVFESRSEIVIWAIVHGAKPRKPGETNR